MANATQIARDSVPKYLYLKPEVPEMIALGVQSPIVIAEQLVLNDRLRPDRYVISVITGLRGSDVRDTRIPHPSAHGEVPYNAFFGGRAADDETPIPTPDGWKLLKELSVGDQVFDDLGKPCNVLGVYPQPPGRRCYEVLFSDCASIVVDADHLWETVNQKSRRRFQSARKLLRNNSVGRRELSSSPYRAVERDGYGWRAYHGSQFRRYLGVFGTELEAAEVASDYRVQRLRE